MNTQRFPTRLFWAAAVAAASLAAPAARADEPGKGATPRPIRALLITGGCCHDYKEQINILSKGVSARARVEWTVVHEGGSSSNHRVSVYEQPNWAANYDVIVHNECFSAVTDKAFIEKALAPHRAGVGAVVVHCAMHTFHDLKTDEWREFLGVDTRGHGPQHPLEVKNLKPSDPIMKDFPSLWTTGNEELYAINRLFPTAVALAQAPENGKQHTVIWTNTYGQGRVFGTTIGHNNKTMQDPVYLDLLTRGLLWSVGQLDENGHPKPGYTAAK